MPPLENRSLSATQCGPENLDPVVEIRQRKEPTSLNGKHVNLFTSDEVSKHDNAEDCWVIHNDFVYNVTDFIEKHPGGAELILNHAGKDISNLFDDVNFHNHSSAAHSMLRDYRVGKLKNFKNKAHHIPDEFSMDGWMEDQVDWNKGMVCQVHKFGSQYMKWCNSPVDRKLRLFDSNFIEFFTKTPWYMIPIIWIPVIIILSYFSIRELYTTISDVDNVQNTDSTYVATATLFSYLFWFCLGAPVWTLVEYLLHRFLFHLEPNDSPYLITFHFFLHGQHHKVPFDNNRLVFPPVAAAVLAVLAYFPFTRSIPGGYGLAMFAGGVLGYVFYDLIHYYLHHGSPERDSYLHSLKHYHVLHHFDDHSTGYGISTKFWDYPFSTVNKKVT